MTENVADKSGTPVTRQQSEDQLATRWSLLARLKNWRDQASWQAFFDLYFQLIYSVALRAGLTDAEAQDVVQDTLLSVAKKIHEFKCDPAAGSFKAWLLKLTRWRILNQLKKRLPEKMRNFSNLPLQQPSHRHDDPARTATVDRVPDSTTLDLDSIWDSEWELKMVSAANERVRQKVSARQFQIFELSAVQGWSVRDVSRLLRVTAGQVYLARHRVSRLLKKEIARLEKQSLGGK